MSVPPHILDPRAESETQTHGQFNPGLVCSLSGTSSLHRATVPADPYRKKRTIRLRRRTRKHRVCFDQRCFHFGGSRINLRLDVSEPQRRALLNHEGSREAYRNRTRRNGRPTRPFPDHSRRLQVLSEYTFSADRPGAVRSSYGGKRGRRHSAWFFHLTRGTDQDQRFPKRPSVEWPSRRTLPNRTS